MLQYKLKNPWGVTEERVNDLTYILSHLPYVTSLSLEGINARFSPFENRLLSMVSVLPDIKELEIHHVTFEAMDDCVDIVYAFPNLSRLTMTHFDWVGSAVDRRKKLQGPAFRFGGLGLNYSGSEDAVDWFLAREPIPTVDTLYCFTYEPNGGIGAQRIMEAVGHSIKTLDISIEHSIGGESYHYPVNRST